MGNFDSRISFPLNLRNCCSPSAPRRLKKKEKKEGNSQNDRSPISTQSRYKSLENRNGNSLEKFVRRFLKLLLRSDEIPAEFPRRNVSSLCRVFWTGKETRIVRICRAGHKVPSTEMPVKRFKTRIQGIVCSSPPLYSPSVSSFFSLDLSLFFQASGNFLGQKSIFRK